MTIYPLALYFNTCLLGNNFRQIAIDWMENVARLGFPTAIAWAAPIPPPGEAMHPGGLEQALQELSVQEGTDNMPTSIDFDLGDDSHAYIYQKREEKNIWLCNLDVYITNTNYSQIPQFINAAASLCRHFLSKRQMTKAKLSRYGGGLSCIPEVPIAGNRNSLIITTQAEVEQNYDLPEAFFSAWDSMEQYGDKYLLLRGMDCSDDLSFLSEIIDRQWNMARAAKPGLTKYFLPHPKPEEIPIFQTEESYLNIVGYIPAEKVVEYACWVDPGFHIQGWEIYNVSELIEVEKLEDGRPVDTVRIVFPNREMAEREKRPLLDIGAQVWYYNPVGETEQIIE